MADKKKQAQKYWVAHAGSVYLPSPKTGELVEYPHRRIVDNVPPSVIDGIEQENWLIRDGLLLPYDGDLPAGRMLPKTDVPEGSAPPAGQDVIPIAPDELVIVEVPVIVLDPPAESEGGQ